MYAVDAGISAVSILCASYAHEVNFINKHSPLLAAELLADISSPALTGIWKKGSIPLSLRCCEWWDLLLEIGKETNFNLFLNFSSLSFPSHLIFCSSDEAQRLLEFSSHSSQGRKWERAVYLRLPKAAQSSPGVNSPIWVRRTQKAPLRRECAAPCSCWKHQRILWWVSEIRTELNLLCAHISCGTSWFC